MNSVRREIFERVFDDLERQHSAFEAFTETMPLQDVDDDRLRYAWQCFRAGWDALSRRPMAAPLSFTLDGPGMPELHAAFDALDRPDDAPFVLCPLLRAVREALGRAAPRVVWGPGAPELRLEVEQLLSARGGIAGLGVSDRWHALIQAARLVVGHGRVWQQ